MSRDIWSDGETFGKRFSEPEALAKELNIYNLGLPITARLRRHSELMLELDYLEGTPYLDHLPSFFPGLLGRAYAVLHRATYDGKRCWCHWDNNPKNILLDRNLTAYYLVDFAEIEFAFPEQDLTHLLLFWIQHFNDEELMLFTELFLKAYTLLMPIDFERWNKVLPESIARFNQRRIDHGKAPMLLLNNLPYIERLIGIKQMAKQKH